MKNPASDRWRWAVLALGLLPAIPRGDLAAGDGPGRPAGGPPLPAQVRDPSAGGEKVAKKKEHCSVDAARLAAIGRAPGQQVRISRGEGDFALFTVGEARDEEADSAVRIGRLGRLRLGSTAEFDGTISAEAVVPGLTEAQAKARGELSEDLVDDGRNTGLLVLAPHGGQVEPPTDQQAARLAAKIGKPDRVSTWRCRGYHPRGGKAAFDRWHITSTDIHEASYPMLARVAGRKFDHAVSFHGMAEDRVLIGGAAPTRLRVEVRDAIREALAGTGVVVDIAMPGDSNGGKDPKNIVNRYAPGGGVQIEQSPKARREHWEAIADAVARVFGPKL